MKKYNLKEIYQKLISNTIPQAYVDWLVAECIKKGLKIVIKGGIRCKQI